MPLHDYRCSEHGLFESMVAHCHQQDCEIEPSIVFLKPVGFVSNKTRNIDYQLRETAASFGMTDLSSAKEGDTQYKNMPSHIPDVEFIAPTTNKGGILWGMQGNLNSAGVFGGENALDLSKSQPKLSPLAEGMRQSHTNLSQNTDIVGTAPGIKRTANGLAQ